MWHVYEIVGEKAGCTRDDRWDVRQKDQKEKGEMIIRSTHDCIYEASDAEIALQKLKGYKVDPLPYHETVRRGLLGTQIARHVKRNINIEACSKGGAASLASGTHVNFQKVKCPHCDMVSNPGGIGMHIKAKH